MNYKQKYKKALEKIQGLKQGHIIVRAEDIEDSFPKLVESEDERIRKDIIKFLIDVNNGAYTKSELEISSWIAWLEKQGEKVNPYSGISFEYNGHIWGMCARDNGVDILFDRQLFNHLEKKVEPKFKVGDWILYSGDHYEGVRHITKIDENGYYIERNGLPHGIIPFNHEMCMRLWSIQDAKDGDVLSYRNGQWIFIYKEKIDDNSFDYHSLYSTIHQDLTINDGAFTLLSDAITPATKEQRDLLFQKMREACYEWDADKRELKKIEQKPADKVEPKFKVGDWVAIKEEIGLCTPLHIVDMDDKQYRVEQIDGSSGTPNIDYLDRFYHLWSIQDAKDGDVLQFNGKPFIYNGYLGEKKYPFAYGGINLYGRFCVSNGLSPITHSDVYPATKEQRDLLFQKMKEEGYEWDAEKKELKEIEDEPENFKRQLMDEITDLITDYVKQKPVWSEEDGKMCQETIDWFEKKCFPYALESENPARESIKWLKSLKQRIGGNL